MTDQMYREIILEHYKNPQNYGVLADANFSASDLNPLCGDEIHLTAKIVNDEIKDIAFESQGCAISKASASLFTEEIKGISIAEIQNMSQETVLALLEIELTPARKKCALLVQKTLSKGLRGYLTDGSSA